MSTRFRSALLASTLIATAGVALSSSAAIAQDKDKAPAAPECNPNAVPTQSLAKATFSMQRAMTAAQAKTDASKDLKDAIKLLTTPDKKEQGDSIGRNYYLAQAYILLIQQPGIKPIGRRGDFGIATDTSLTVDLLAAADTVISKVEHDAPVCRSEMAKWRQQQPWLDALNGSINALNAEKFDSAEALAKRSLIIDRTSPYAYAVLADVASRRNDYDVAVANLRKSLELAGKDTAYADQRDNSLFNIANTLNSRAKAASGADQKAKAQEAIAAWNDYMKEGKRDLRIANAVQQVKNLLQLTGDTTHYEQSYATIVSNPANYGESTLLTSGLIATQARKPDDAVKLFAAVIEKNPYQRDALNNLAASYSATKQPEKMIPLIDRLVKLDPNNADNWLLYAYAYSGLLKGTKDPKLTKTYTDSLMYFNTKSEQLSPRLALTAFSHTEKQTSLAGTIENYVPKGPTSVSGKAMKNTAKVAATPKTYTISVEFLDAKGEVIGTQTKTVGPVAPGATESFTVTLEGKEAMGFRYKLS